MVRIKFKTIEKVMEIDADGYKFSGNNTLILLKNDRSFFHCSMCDVLWVRLYESEEQ